MSWWQLFLVSLAVVIGVYAAFVAWLVILVAVTTPTH